MIVFLCPDPDPGPGPDPGPDPGPFYRIFM